MTNLTQKKCKPCEGIGRAYTKEAAAAALKEVPGWQLAKDGKAIQCTFVMKNFTTAVDFIGRIAEVAEAEDHHPDIYLTGYRNLVVELSTHALGGLSENDFIVAAKIKELPGEFKEDLYQK